jgi:hypothetical protein
MSFTRIALALTPVFATLLALAPGVSSAEAGTITAASGPFKVNGSNVTLEAGKTITLKKDDRFETGQSSVTYRSDTGDVVTFESGSVGQEYETTDVAAGVFLVKGSASGVLTGKTQVGVAAGWISAKTAVRTKVYVDAIAGRENSEAQFRAVEGSAWISYRAFNVTLLPAHTVTINIDPSALGTFCFRTGQQNAGEVEVRKSTAAGEIVASVPKATLGCFTDEANNKTKICNDINSLKTAKIRLQTLFAGKSDNTAAIGPGTCALIDNATGAIQVLFAAVKFEILERAIGLTSEFSTLAQSNFSDVK